MKHHKTQCTDVEASLDKTKLVYGTLAPKALKNSLVSRTIEECSPWLQATMDSGNGAVLKIKKPTEEQLKLFIRMNGGSLGLLWSKEDGPRRLDEVFQELWGLIDKYRFFRHKERCKKCGGALCGVSYKTKRSTYPITEICEGSCKHKFITILTLNQYLKTPIEHPGAETIEKILCKNFNKAARKLVNKTISQCSGKFHGQDYELANLDVGTKFEMMNKRPIDVMLMLGSDPNFMPEFCNAKELELYNNLCRLDSWAHPTFTMFFVPPLYPNEKSEHRRMADAYVKLRGGEPIVNKGHRYMVRSQDRQIAKRVCDVFHMRTMYNTLVLELHWFYACDFQHNAHKGYWCDICPQKYTAPCPRNMKKVASIAGLRSIPKTNQEPIYIINAQELDLIMMDEILTIISSTNSVCHMVGLPASIHELGGVRMNGRPFLFFAWWRGIRPEKAEFLQPNPCITTPPLDTTLQELTFALQDGTLSPEFYKVPDGAISLWLNTLWTGVEITVGPFPERFKRDEESEICKRVHLKNFTFVDKLVVRKTKEGTFIMLKDDVPGKLAVLRFGDDANIIRTNSWGAIPDESWADSLDSKWSFEMLPDTAELTGRSYLCYNPPPGMTIRAIADMKGKLDALKLMGLILYECRHEVTPEITEIIDQFIPQTHCILPINEAAPEACDLAFHCYHGAIANPNIKTFAMCKNKESKPEVTNKLMISLDLIRKRKEKKVKDVLQCLRFLFETMVERENKHAEKKKERKRKRAEKL